MIRLARSSVVASHCGSPRPLRFGDRLAAGLKRSRCQTRVCARVRQRPRRCPSPPSVGEAVGFPAARRHSAGDARPGPDLRRKRPVQRAPAADFANHFFFEDRTNYFSIRRQLHRPAHQYRDHQRAAQLGVFNSTGYPDPAVFQPNSNRIETFLDFGTRGWLSDRVNTHFGVSSISRICRTWTKARPLKCILETFGSNRVPRGGGKLPSKSMASRPTAFSPAPPSRWAGNMFMAPKSPPSMAWTSPWIAPATTVTIFGGRRFTFFSDPEQRALGRRRFHLQN